MAISAILFAAATALATPATPPVAHDENPPIQLATANGRATVRLLTARVIRWDSFGEDVDLPAPRPSQVRLPDGSTANAQVIEFE